MTIPSRALLAVSVAAALSAGCLTRSAPEGEPVPPPAGAPSAPSSPPPTAGPDPAIAQAEARARDLEIQVLEKEIGRASCRERV